MLALQLWPAAAAAQDAQAPTPTPAPAPAPAPAPDPTAPFGPGAPVHVTSSGASVTVFVARVGAGGPDVLEDTDFKRVGKSPISISLPPGTYRIEVEAIGISNQGLLFEMHDQPRRLLVRPGSESLSTTGTLLLAAGITGVAAGLVILISGSKAPSSLDKASVLIPTFAVGGVLLGAGIGMTIAGNTNLEEQKGHLPKNTAGRGFALGLRGSF